VEEAVVVVDINKQTKEDKQKRTEGLKINQSTDSTRFRNFLATHVGQKMVHFFGLGNMTPE